MWFCSSSSAGLKSVLGVNHNKTLQNQVTDLHYGCHRFTPSCNSTTGPVLFVNIDLLPQLSHSCGPGAPVISGACCSTKCVYIWSSKTGDSERKISDFHDFSTEFLQFKPADKIFSQLFIFSWLSVLVRSQYRQKKKCQPTQKWWPRNLRDSIITGSLTGADNLKRMFLRSVDMKSDLSGP